MLPVCHNVNEWHAFPTRDTFWKHSLPIRRHSHFQVSGTALTGISTVASLVGRCGKIAGPVTRESPGSVISWVNLDSLAASPGLENHVKLLEIAPGTHSFHSV